MYIYYKQNIVLNHNIYVCISDTKKYKNTYIILILKYRMKANQLNRNSTKKISDDKTNIAKNE